MIDFRNEVAKCILKVHGTIVVSKFLEVYSPPSWVLCHLQRVSAKAWWPSRLWWHTQRIEIMCGLQPPLNNSSMLLHLLMALQPQSHLRIFIFVVRCTVSILGEVNVEMLRLFSVIVISGAKESNR